MPPAFKCRSQNFTFFLKAGFECTASSKTMSTGSTQSLKSSGLYPLSGTMFAQSRVYLSKASRQNSGQPGMVASSSAIHGSLTHGSMQNTVAFGGADFDQT